MHLHLLLHLPFSPLYLLFASFALARTGERQSSEPFVH